MPYGLRVINNDSELLIDSELVNPTFVQKLEFNATPTFTEAGPNYAPAHPGYIRRDYSTSNFSAASGGNYIILWALPDTIPVGQPFKDVWYNFPTSSITMSTSLQCSVYANSEGSPITYALPTAYIFAVNAAAVNAMASTGPALRMYNSSQVKTFDSNFVQLVPYSITDSFNIPGADTTTSLYLPVPTNPIYLVPKSVVLFAIDTGYGYSLEKVFDACYRRRGSYIDSRTISTSYSDNNPPMNTYFASFFAGNVGNLSVIAADADFYQSSGASTGGGANPTYVLSSTTTSTNEGTSITITLTTTLVNDGSAVEYTVTGVAAADLTAGGTTGTFNVNNNTATATFTFANDYLTEGTEVFKLSLNGLPQYIEVSVLDTSITPVYSWSTPNNVNEGSSGYTTFNATNANNKVVTFAVIAPSAGSGLAPISVFSDGSLLTTSWTVNGNAATSINVQYSAVADAITEGPEGFRLTATVDGVTYTSNDITVNDTSKAGVYGISAADNWNESNTYAVTITANNVNGTTLYLTTNNSLVIPESTSVLVNSDSFSTNINFSAGIVTTDTAVVLQLRTGSASASGTIVATKGITVKNVAPAYSFGTVAALNEGSSGSVQFNYSYAANKSVTFATAAPTSGSNGSGSVDISLNTTSLTIGNTNASGATTVNYSAASDLLTEGAKYFRIAATVDGSTYYSDNITINDTSLTAPTYTLSASPNTTSEGNSFTVTFNTNQAGSFGYTITGVNSADIGNTSLTGTLSNGGTRVFNVTADNLTEGTETFVMALDNGQASVSVTISDTSVAATSINQSGNTSSTVNTSFSTNFVMTVNNSQYPAMWSYSGAIPPGTTFTQSGNTFGNFYQIYTLSGTPTTVGTYNFTVSATASTGDSTSKNVSVVVSNIASGTYLSQFCSGVDLYYTYANGSGGTYNQLQQANSPTCGYVAPSYSLSIQPSTSINEGAGFNATLTTNQSGSFAYTISGVTSADIGGASLTGTLSNGQSRSISVTADSITEGTEYLTISLDNGLASATVTIADTSLYPPYGTYLSQFCSGVDLYYTYANGSGGIYTELQQANSTTCGYVAPTYSLSVQPSSSINEGAGFSVTLTTNQSGNFPYTISGITSADIGGASLTGTLSNGQSRGITVAADSLTEGTEYLTVSLDNGLASTTVTIGDTSTASLSIEQSANTSGTQNSSFTTYFVMKVNGSQYPAMWSYSGPIPPGTTFTQSGNTFGNFYQIYTLSGTPTSSGTYNFTVNATASTGDSTSKSVSLTIAAPSYPAYGTYLSQYCSGYSLYYTYANGSGGTYDQLQATNSPTCGYVAPTYSLGNTWTSLANGAAASFYVRSNNASGVTLTPSKSGAGASRVSISPTSSTINSNGQTDTYFTVTATTPTSTVSAQSVTISVAGTSFTFDVQAFSVSTIPTVTSITYFPNEFSYGSGVQIFATINLSGPITAGTYVRVLLDAGVYGSGFNVYQAGTDYPGESDGSNGAGFPIGASSGYYYAPPNPGFYQTTIKISARTENSSGVAQQSYVNGPTRTLLASDQGGGGIEA